MARGMEIRAFFHEPTYTLTYLVWDPETRDAVVIDPVRDYDQGASKTGTAALDALDAALKGLELKLRFVLETHAHADHLSGAPVLRERHGAPVGIGARIVEVQALFKDVFDMPANFSVEGRQFDRLLGDGEVLEAGSLEVEVISTPGHTPACVSYRIGDALFTGDALFMDDYGTGRCDFPGGSADQLYSSIHDRLYALPDATRVFVGHDYQPGGRALAYETSIGKSKANNPQLRGDTSREDFVRFREQRDAGLKAPRLLYPSVQINVDGGQLPEPADNGTRYLRIPIR